MRVGTPFAVERSRAAFPVALRAPARYPLRPMLEPLDPRTLPPLAFRAATIRQGMDLEPELPDPAPAFVDPDSAMHPALTAPLPNLTLFSFPTAAARSAILGRILSEPGRARPEDRDDPFVAFDRLADREGWEPEARGCLALLVLRGLLAGVHESARGVDPDVAHWDGHGDPWFRRRPRLLDAGPRAVERIERIHGISKELSRRPADPDLAFERVIVESSASWIAATETFWGARSLLGPDERVPEDEEARVALRIALRRTRTAVARCVALPRPERISPAELLGEVLHSGLVAENEFLHEIGQRPDGPVTAQWLVQAQVRAMRDLMALSRERSLRLHTILRRIDRARLAAQIAWRVALLDLWIADVEGRPTEAAENALLHLPDPLLRTTLFVGLGRLRGFVLVRRLRRGQLRHALDIADGALHLAPEDLAIRLCRNDLAFHLGRPRPLGRRGLVPVTAGASPTRWDKDLVASLRAEADRWSSISVAAMGGAVSRFLGDRASERRFRPGVVERCLSVGTPDAWIVAVIEALADPAMRADPLVLDRLLQLAPKRVLPAGPLSAVVADSLDEPELARTLDDVGAALLDARVAIDLARSIETGEVAAKKVRGPAWKQVLQLPWPGPGQGDAEEVLASRLQALRASCPALRQPPVAAKLRSLVGELDRAADLDDGEGIGEEARTAALDLLRALPSMIRAHVETPTPNHELKLCSALDEALHHLRVALAEPRLDALRTGLRRLGARGRAAFDTEVCDFVSEALARIAAAPIDAALDALLHRIEREVAGFTAGQRATAPGAGAAAEPGQMHVHEDFVRFSTEELGLREDHLWRVYEMIDLFNLSGGRRDRKRLKGEAAMGLHELRAKSTFFGALRVFYRRHKEGWIALAAMRKHDERDQNDAIERVARAFAH